MSKITPSASETERKSTLPDESQYPRRLAYSVPETMYMLNLSRTGIYEQVKKKRLRMTKIGRKSIFLASDISEFLAQLQKGDAK